MAPFVPVSTTDSVSGLPDTTVMLGSALMTPVVRIVGNTRSSLPVVVPAVSTE